MTKIIKIIRTKLSPKAVKTYEEMSGFKTTGEVYLDMWDEKTGRAIHALMLGMFTPATKPNKNKE